MKGVAREMDWQHCPQRIAGVLPRSQVFLTAVREYEVHAISVTAGVVYFHVVDDLRMPSWLPAWLFDVSDKSVPNDWICNAFHDDERLVLGPEFMARDDDALSEMSELQRDQVERFWARIHRRALRADEDT